MKADEIRACIYGLLSDLEEGIAARVRNIPIGSGTIAISLTEIRPRNTPLSHLLELRDSETIYYRGHCIPLLQNQAVEDELDKMLKVRIVTTAYYAWSFPVVIAKKGRKVPLLC